MRRAFGRCVLLLAVVATLGTSVVTAAPELGGRLSPVPLVYERQPWVQLTNLSTMAVVATIETEGGWTVETDRLTLDPGERQRVAVVTAGPEDAVLRAHLAPAEALTGPDVNALVLETIARHERPWEAVDGPWWLLLLLPALVAVWAALRRHRRA
jgi:hypothetical protein